MGRAATFLRHGDLTQQVSVDIRYVRDFNNVLGFLKKEEHEDLLFAINEDTFGHICKFHNIAKKEVLQKAQPTSAANRATTAVQGIKNPSLQYFMVVELRVNGVPVEPKFYTNLQKNFEVNEKITFPIRYCDLSQVSLLGVTIYDMHRPLAQSVVASTTIDLFDRKHRLRQGVLNLQLYPGLEADIT